MIDLNFSANKVIDFKSPQEMEKIFKFEILENEEPLNDHEFLELTQKIIRYSVHTGHQNFYNTLFGGNDEYALSGDFITSVLNGTMYSYEMAPVFSLMERSIFKLFSDYIGWKIYDGMSCPGGSLANMHGLMISRFLKYPEIKKKGIRNLAELIIFTSELGHYSISKSAVCLGFGLENVWAIPSDKKGRIDVLEFIKLIEKAKKENKIPLAINCTIGTTVFGTIDPIDEIADICKENDIFLHIDACLGGALILLEEFKNNFLKGIEKADSIVIDTHKVFPIPLQCSFFLTRHKDSLWKCNSLNAEYLFMKDKIIYDSCLDSGDASLQCGRHVDILKLWLYMKGNGFTRIQNQVRKAILNAKYLAILINNHPNFILIVEPDFINVSFYYLSDSLLKKFNVDSTNKTYQDLEDDQNIDWDDVAKLAPIIKAKMMKEGTMMIAYQKQTQKNRSLSNFFRAVVTLNKEKIDMEFIIDEIHRLGKDI